MIPFYVSMKNCHRLRRRTVHFIKYGNAFLEKLSFPSCHQYRKTERKKNTHTHQTRKHFDFFVSSSLLFQFFFFLFYILIKKQFSLSIFRLYFIAFVLHCRSFSSFRFFVPSLWCVSFIRVRLSLKRHNDIKSGH